MTKPVAENKTTLLSDPEAKTRFLGAEDFSKIHTAFPMGTLRNLIFGMMDNGLAECGAIMRIYKRKIVIDEAKFLKWAEEQGRKNYMESIRERRVPGGKIAA